MEVYIVNFIDQEETEEYRGYEINIENNMVSFLFVDDVEVKETILPINRILRIDRHSEKA